MRWFIYCIQNFKNLFCICRLGCWVWLERCVIGWWKATYGDGSNLLSEVSGHSLHNKYMCKQVECLCTCNYHIKILVCFLSSLIVHFFVSMNQKVSFGFNKMFWLLLERHASLIVIRWVIGSFLRVDPLSYFSCHKCLVCAILLSELFLVPASAPRLV